MRNTPSRERPRSHQTPHQNAARVIGRGVLVDAHAERTMITVFLGGSRSITTIAPCIQPRLAAIVARGHAVLVGDAPGADSSFQRSLAQVQYRNVTVFSSGASARTNIGAWPTHA